MTDEFFSEKNKVDTPSSFFKFRQVGDCVKGYLLNKREVPPRGAYPEQIHYYLKDIDGFEWIVARPKKNIGIHKSLEAAKRGQLIGFKFTEELPNPGRNATKIIQVFIGDEFAPEHLIGTELKEQDPAPQSDPVPEAPVVKDSVGEIDPW